MNKNIRNTVIAIVIGVLIIISGRYFIFGTFYQKGNYSETAQFKIPSLDTYKLFFYDNNTNCNLNGEVWADGNFLGDAKNGILEYSNNEEEKLKQSSMLFISGLTDGCFGKENNLPYMAGWELLGAEKSEDKFIASLTPRNPTFYGAMQGFIRPAEARGYLPEISKYIKSNDTLEILDKLTNFRMQYIRDYDQFKQVEYWQTPTETLTNQAGDCEDWAVAGLSLIRAYKPELKCYDVIWQTHISIFCSFGLSFAIYDQGGTRSVTVMNPNKEGYQVEQENRIKIREMKDKYFEDYGILPNERAVYSAFNEEEIVTFENDEQFVDWALRLLK